MFKKFSFLLKEPMVLKELSILARELSFFLGTCNIFPIFTTVNVERKVLINLGFVERNHLNFGRSGVDEALCPSS